MGRVVTIIKVGNDYDPCLLIDITLTRYYNTIDYLGYYQDTYRSIIDRIGIEAFLAKKILAKRAIKVIGVRINCVGDQAGS